MLVSISGVTPNYLKSMLMPLVTSSGRVESSGPGQVLFDQLKDGYSFVKLRANSSTEPSKTATQAASHLSEPVFLMQTLVCEQLSHQTFLSANGYEVLSEFGEFCLTQVSTFTSCSPSVLENQKSVLSGMNLMFHECFLKYAQFSGSEDWIPPSNSLIYFCSLLLKSLLFHLAWQKANLMLVWQAEVAAAGRRQRLARVWAASANFLVLASMYDINYIQTSPKVILISTMLGKEKQEVGMNLPVGNHIDRLAEMIVAMRDETEGIEKDLQILRGNITQLSYINKESDKELNAFLIDSIAALRNKWSAEWEQNVEELAEHKKKLAKIEEEHEDVEITREELDEKVINLEAAVGLRLQ